MGGKYISEPWRRQISLLDDQIVERDGIALGNTIYRRYIDMSDSVGCRERLVQSLTFVLGRAFALSDQTSCIAQSEIFGLAVP